LLVVRQGQLAIAFVCVVLGFMLAIQFRTTQSVRSAVPFQRAEDIAQRLTQTEKERDALSKQLQEIRNSNQFETASKEFQTIKMSAGMLAVEGPGIIVTIDDSKRAMKPGENPNLYLIHDDDILKIINELWAAGAEAISINEQRLITTSEIRCAGPTLSVNNTRYSPPYDLRVIGEPQTLENALKMRGGVIETLQFWGIQVSVKRQELIRVPAYKGIPKLEYARPVKVGES